MSMKKPKNDPQSSVGSSLPFRFSWGEFRGALHQQHRSLPLAQVLAILQRHIVRQWWFAEVVGAWVWVHVSDTLTQLERSQLFELGFHWSARRQAWQHPCGAFQSPASREQFVRYFPAEQGAQSPEFAPHS